MNLQYTQYTYTPSPPPPYCSCCSNPSRVIKENNDRVRKMLNQPHLSDFEIATMMQKEDEETMNYLIESRIQNNLKGEIFKLLKTLIRKEWKEAQVQTTRDWIKNRLGNKVANVLISNEHSSSSSPLPCVLTPSKVLEINPDHPIIMNLEAACKSNPDDKEALRAIDLLYDVALLSSGFKPDNPAQLGVKIYDIMDIALCGKWSPQPTGTLPH